MVVSEQDATIDISKVNDIGVIFGGVSSEKEVSLATGRYIFSLLDPQIHQGVAIYMDQQGDIWQIPGKLILQNSTRDIEEKLAETEGVEKLEWEELSEKVDLMFIALLGKVGEDGTIQGILELLDIPFTGSGILASAVGMNKKVHKTVISRAGYQVAKDLVVRKHLWDTEEYRDKIHQQIKDQLQWPVIIKPVAEGSSIGVTKANDRQSLDQALQEAFRWDPEALIEEFIYGREFMCVAWGNRHPQAMLPTEVVFEGDIYSYEGKYMPGKTKTVTPAPFKKDTLRRIQETAVDIYQLINVQGYGRVDGWVVESDEADDQIVIGEPHTGTIMVPSSYVFQQAAKFNLSIENKKVSSGLNPRKFISRIIQLAFEAHQEKKQLL